MKNLNKKAFGGLIFLFVVMAAVLLSGMEDTRLAQEETCLTRFCL
jgi:hypothetical protein